MEHVINGIVIGIGMKTVRCSPHKDGWRVICIADEYGEHTVKKVHAAVGNVDAVFSDTEKTEEKFPCQKKDDEPDWQFMPDIPVCDTAVDISLKLKHKEEKDSGDCKQDSTDCKCRYARTCRCIL